MDYRMCTRCIMDTTDPEIAFDEDGHCNHCNEYYNTFPKGEYLIENSDQQLMQMVKKIKIEMQNKPYDCVIGLSGGVDSSYVAYKAHQLGLRLLAVHCDTGWNSELAVKNIENIVNILGIDLYTYIVDWEEMRDLQLAFFKSSVANCDIPQDHAIVATMLSVARKYNIHYILSGSNIATEFILPPAWGYDNLDITHIKAIHKRFGSIPLKKFPMVNIWQRYVRSRFSKKNQIVKILNYIHYNKAEAMKEMEEKLHWQYYGGKHYESVFTRFFQGYYLPTKFGYDKRIAHLSSLIVSGQITREEALEEMKKQPYAEKMQISDKEFVAKKLELSVDEFDEIMKLPNRTYRDYPNEERYRLFLRRMVQLKRKLLNQ